MMADVVVLLGIRLHACALRMRSKSYIWFYFRARSRKIEVSPPSDVWPNGPLTGFMRTLLSSKVELILK